MNGYLLLEKEIQRLNQQVSQLAAAQGELLRKVNEAFTSHKAAITQLHREVEELKKTAPRKIGPARNSYDAAKGGSANDRPRAQ